MFKLVTLPHDCPCIISFNCPRNIMRCILSCYVISFDCPIPSFRLNKGEPWQQIYVLNPIDGPFSNYTNFRADLPLTSTTCIKYAEFPLNFINTFEIMKLLRPKNHGIIFESMKFTSKVPFDTLYWICQICTELHQCVWNHHIIETQESWNHGIKF